MVIAKVLSASYIVRNALIVPLLVLGNSRVFGCQHDLHELVIHDVL